jgi:hypothetical protein
MVEAGVMQLVEKVPGEPILAPPRGPGNGEICVFAPCRDSKTEARVKFSVTTCACATGAGKPILSRDQEAALIDVLREILREEETTIDRE